MRVHDLLESSARQHPDAVALVAGARTATYAELDALSNRFADVCLQAGVRPGDRVAIALENSIELVACYFGAMKAGGVAVPLPPGSRSDRLPRALLDCTPRLAVIDARTRAGLSEVPNATRVLVHANGTPPGGPGSGSEGSLGAALAGAAAAPPSVSTREHDLAALIYTSGSTAQPRGVMLTHRNIVANTRSIAGFLSLTARDRVVCVLPFYYVYGLSLLHTHVMTGGTVVLENRGAFANVILQTLVTQRATGFAGVPSSFSFLLRHSNLRRVQLPDLRYVTQAGAAMPPYQIMEWLEAVPGVPFFVMYGATEAAARLTYLPPEDLTRKLGSIGRPIAGVEIDVITDDGRIAGCGDVGELVARGPNVSPGYWNDPRATCERFGPNGFRTGDLGYRDSDGYLYVVGRRHDMLKIGGHRVSPAEIEQVLQEHPAVIEAAVVGVPDERLGERPAAFVVPRDPAAAAVSALRAFCAARLPAPKVPVFINFQKEMPKLASGKLDRQALRAWALASVPEPSPTSHVSTGCSL